MASLEEVYGPSFNKKKKKRSKKKKQPLCNYYARQYKKSNRDEPYTIQSNDSINNYAQYNIDDYNVELTGKKNKYRSDNRYEPKEFKLYVDDEEEHDYFDKLYNSHEFKPQERTNGNNLMRYERDEDSDEDSDEELEKEQINRRMRTDTMGRSNNMPLTPMKSTPLYERNGKDYEPDQNYLDFGLYLISGVLLIFILEQFVQLGMILKEKRPSPIFYTQE